MGDSRTPFVKEVAKTMTERHGNESGSFIFGISGKWGEGKTRFLDELRKTLETGDSSFIVVDINPWKYSVDRISFLRNFLRELNKKCASKSETDLRELDVDTSANSINWGRFVAFVLPLGIVCGIFAYAPQFKINITLNKELQFFLTVLFIPILLAAVQSIVTVQKTDHAITTLDKFDDLLDKILRIIRSNDKKIIVFVDDLDRVTPEMARDVLDNLRTFFDKKDITFVVTGDHTVLEGHLGRSLLPDEESSAAQLEEGRRFMKKIFNVYWRLPLPIKKELQDFIKGEFDKRTEVLKDVFSQESEKAMFAIYLEKYFESNFRQIIRFLDTVLFNFQIIIQKAKSEDVQQASYFEEMITKPLLVVRMLMIQEICAPLFDKMVRDVSILQGLEYAVERKNTSNVKQILDQSNGVLSPSQRAFIEKYIYEEPRFYKDSRLQVLNLQPYLSLAADVSFGDQRGPSGEDFKVTLSGGDPAGVKNDLLSMGDEKAQESVNAITTQLPSMPDVAQQIATVKTLVVALVDLPVESTVHKIFADKLSEIDYTFINNAVAAQKMEVINPFWQWLDLLKKNDVENMFQDKFTLRDMTEFNAVDLTNASEFKSRMVAKWLKEQYSTQTAEILGAMTTHFPKLISEKVHEQLDTISGSLITDLIQDTNSQNRENRFVLIKDYTTNGASDLKTNVLNRVYDFDQAITPWVIDKAKEEYPLWTSDEIETKVLSKIDTTTDFNVLHQCLRFAIANKIGSRETIWPKLIPTHKEVIIENLPTIIDDASLEVISPPQAYANQLMDAVVEKIKIVPEADQARWLGYIVKGKWLWVNLAKYPIASKFRTLKKTNNAEIKQSLETSEESWKEKKY